MDENIDLKSLDYAFGIKQIDEKFGRVVAKQVTQLKEGK